MLITHHNQLKKQQPMKEFLITFFDIDNQPCLSYVEDYPNKSIANVRTQTYFEEMREKHGKDFIHRYEISEFNGYQETEN